MRTKTTPPTERSRRRFAKFSREIRDAIEYAEASAARVPIDQLEEWYERARQMENAIRHVARRGWDLGPVKSSTILSTALRRPNGKAKR